MAKKKKASAKFNLVTELHEAVISMAEVTRSGEVRVKRTELKDALENVFNEGAKRAAAGERIRFPIIGALVRKDVPARKAKKGVNPFTGEPMMIKARKATKKPRWSFPKAAKEIFANKRFW